MAVNQQTLQGNWNQIRGKVRNKWGELTDQDLQEVRGNVDQLVGLIQRKSGEGREAIMRYLEELTAEGASAAEQVTEVIREKADWALESAQAASAQVADTVRAGYRQAGEMVRQRPTESLAVCFGAGLITGVILGMLLRAK